MGRIISKTIVSRAVEKNLELIIQDYVNLEHHEFQAPFDGKVYELAVFNHFATDIDVDYAVSLWDKEDVDVKVTGRAEILIRVESDSFIGEGNVGVGIYNDILVDRGFVIDIKDYEWTFNWRDIDWDVDDDEYDEDAD